MNRIISVLIAAVVLSASVAVFAEEGKVEKKGDGEKKAPVPAKEITLTGKLTKKEVGMEEKKVVYTLKTADGVEVKIPEPKAKEGAEAIKLADFVDKDVVITAQGFEKEGKEGKKAIMVKSVVKIVLAEVKKDAEKPAEKPAEAAK